MRDRALLSLTAALLALVAGTLGLDVPAGSSSATLQLPLNQANLVYADTNGATSFMWSVPANSPGPVALSTPTGASTKIAMLYPGTYTVTLAVTFTAKPNATLITTITVLRNPWQATVGTTALELLQNQVAGVFRTGHTLPPLSGMIQHYIPMQIEMSDRWGYALNVGILPDCNPNAASASGPPSYNGNHLDECLSIALRGNGRYKVVAGAANILPGYGRSGQTFLSDAAATNTTIPESVWLHNAQGTRLPSQTNPGMSPLAPESWVAAQAAPLGTCARRISQVYPLSMVTSGGEYGVDLPGWGMCNFLQDLDLLAAIGFPNQPDPSCYQNSSYANEARNTAIIAYGNTKSAIFERIIRQALANVTWAAGVANYGLYTDSYGQDRGRWNGWPSWMRDFADSVSVGVSSMPNPQIYFNDNNAGWGGIDQLGNPADMTWKLLNEVGGGIRFGFKNSYAWMSAGGYAAAGNRIAEQDRWIGFLKIFFTSGGLGATTGYFDYTTTYTQQVVRGAPIGTTLPIWLRQYMDVGRVQALFSYFEDYLRTGDLVAGSYNHTFSVDTTPIPLYCLDIVGEPQGNGISPKSYVLARKLPSQQSWLVTAWSQQGPDRNVTAVLPTAGNVLVNARVSGSVYIVTKSGDGTLSMSHMDPDPLNSAALYFGDAAPPMLVAGYPTASTNTANAAAAASTTAVASVTASGGSASAATTAGTTAAASATVALASTTTAATGSSAAAAVSLCAGVATIAVTAFVALAL